MYNYTKRFRNKCAFLFQTEIGRLLFARLVSAQRSRSKRVSENTFYSLVQHFAIVLFECYETDDFSPAKILMNMCFTFFYEGDFIFFSVLFSKFEQERKVPGNKMKCF